MQTIASNKTAAISAAHQAIKNEGEKATFIGCIEDYAKRAQTPQEFNAAVTGHLGALASVGFHSLAQSLLSAIQTETENLEAVNTAALEKASADALPPLLDNPTPKPIQPVTATTPADSVNTAAPGGPDLGKPESSGVSVNSSPTSSSFTDI